MLYTYNYDKSVSHGSNSCVSHNDMKIIKWVQSFLWKHPEMVIFQSYIDMCSYSYVRLRLRRIFYYSMYVSIFPDNTNTDNHYGRRDRMIYPPGHRYQSLWNIATCIKYLSCVVHIQWQRFFLLLWDFALYISPVTEFNDQKQHNRNWYGVIVRCLSIHLISTYSFPINFINLMPNAVSNKPLCYSADIQTRQPWIGTPSGGMRKFPTSLQHFKICVICQYFTFDDTETRFTAVTYY